MKEKYVRLIISILILAVVFVFTTASEVDFFSCGSMTKISIQNNTNKKIKVILEGEEQVNIIVNPNSNYLISLKKGDYNWYAIDTKTNKILKKGNFNLKMESTPFIIIK